MPEQSKIEEVVFAAIREYNAQAPEDGRIAVSLDTRLFGKEGCLDSLALVNLVLCVEQHLVEAFQKEVTIADERALSRKSSPFQTVGTLCDYASELLQGV